MSQDNQSVLLAVGGGIAAFKSAILCSRLAQCGYHVRVAMTDSATQFIGADTLAALSGRQVVQGIFNPAFPLGAHIEIVESIDVLAVVPTTANLLAKFANGIADDLVSTAYLQATCPVLLAPAMSAAMWSKPAVQRNISQLREDGCHFIGPESGWLSCRVSGEGRMSEPDAILEAIESILND
ncbi:MAG: flavoprotein [Planctomycetota bacterium]